MPPPPTTTTMSTTNDGDDDDTYWIRSQRNQFYKFSKHLVLLCTLCNIVCFIRFISNKYRHIDNKSDHEWVICSISHSQVSANMHRLFVCRASACVPSTRHTWYCKSLSPAHTHTHVELYPTPNGLYRFNRPTDRHPYLCRAICISHTTCRWRSSCTHHCIEAWIRRANTLCCRVCTLAIITSEIRTVGPKMFRYAGMKFHIQFFWTDPTAFIELMVASVYDNTRLVLMAMSSRLQSTKIIHISIYTDTHTPLSLPRHKYDYDCVEFISIPLLTHSHTIEVATFLFFFLSLEINRI